MIIGVRQLHEITTLRAIIGVLFIHIIILAIALIIIGPMINGLITDNILGNRIYGTNEDSILSVQQTSDGGYILTGETSTLSNWDTDTWFIKTDSNGEKLWDLTFRGAEKI